jgi:hypothetical protein
LADRRLLRCGWVAAHVVRGYLNVGPEAERPRSRSRTPATVVASSRGRRARGARWSCRSASPDSTSQRRERDRAASGAGVEGRRRRPSIVRVAGRSVKSPRGRGRALLRWGFRGP